MPGGPDVPEVIRRYFHGVNEEDWADFREVWHEDAVLEVVGGLRFEGVDEILDYYPQVLANFPVHRDEPTLAHLACDVVTVEISFRGETAAGVPASFEALDVFRLEGGRIRRLSIWYELGRVVGLLREPGSPERRLEILVRHAAAASPFYRRRFEELSLDPERVAADLSLLPVTRAGDAPTAELVAAPEGEIRLLVAPGAALATVPLAREDVDELTRQWALALELAGVVRGDVVAARLSAVGLGRAAADVGVPLVSGSSGVEAERAAEATVVFRPVGEAGESAGLRAIDVLASPETGIVASACREGGLHVHAASQVVEIVEGELVVTPLGRRALPLLRWATGDAAAWTGPCRCGSTLPVVRLGSAA